MWGVRAAAHPDPQSNVAVVCGQNLGWLRRQNPRPHNPTLNECQSKSSQTLSDANQTHNIEKNHCDQSLLRAATCVRATNQGRFGFPFSYCVCALPLRASSILDVSPDSCRRRRRRIGGGLYRTLSGRGYHHVRPRPFSIIRFHSLLSEA